MNEAQNWAMYQGMQNQQVMRPLEALEARERHLQSQLDEMTPERILRLNEELARVRNAIAALKGE